MCKYKWGFLSWNGCGGKNLGCMCIAWGRREEWVGVGKGEPGLLFFLFQPLAAGPSWHMIPILTGAWSPTSPSFPHRASGTGTVHLPASPRHHPAYPQSLLLMNIKVRTPCPLSVCGHQNSCPKLVEAKKPCRYGCVRDFYEILTSGRFILATELPFCYGLCFPGESLQGADGETLVGLDWLVSPWGACECSGCVCGARTNISCPCRREPALQVAVEPTCLQGCTAGTARTAASDRSSVGLLRTVGLW